MENDNAAPFPPKFVFEAVEFNFTALPPGMPFPVVIQVQLRLVRPTAPQEGPAQRTSWFALTPASARQFAAALEAAANQAEKTHLPTDTLQ